MANYVVNIVKGRPDRTHTLREVIGVASTIQSARKIAINYVGKSKDKFAVISAKPSLKKGSRFLSEIRKMDEVEEDFAFGKGDVEVLNYVPRRKQYLTSKPPLYDDYVVDMNGKILFMVDYWN